MFRLYGLKWQYASIKEMLRIFLAQVIINLTLLFLSRVILEDLVPLRVSIIFAVLFAMGIMVIRMSYRVLRYLQHEYIRNRGGIGGRIVIVGAGEAGTMLLHDINNNPERGQVVALVDDDTEKHNASISGVRVMGGTDDIIEICEKRRRKRDNHITAFGRQLYNKADTQKMRKNPVQNIYNAIGARHHGRRSGYEPAALCGA